MSGQNSFYTGKYKFNKLHGEKILLRFTVASLVKKFSKFMQHKGSIPCLERPAT
jgi:hypothetical protein